MASVVIQCAVALGVLHRASCGRPKYENDALEPADGVRMLASGSFVKEAHNGESLEADRSLLTFRNSDADMKEDSVPSMLELKLAAASLQGSPSNPPPHGGP